MDTYLSLAPFMCVHACLLTCIALPVQIAEGFKLLSAKRNTPNLNGSAAD